MLEINLQHSVKHLVVYECSVTNTCVDVVELAVIHV